MFYKNKFRFCQGYYNEANKNKYNLNLNNLNKH